MKAIEYYEKHKPAIIGSLILSDEEQFAAINNLKTDIYGEFFQICADRHICDVNFAAGAKEKGKKETKYYEHVTQNPRKNAVINELEMRWNKVAAMINKEVGREIIARNQITAYHLELNPPPPPVEEETKRQPHRTIT